MLHLTVLLLVHFLALTLSSPVTKRIVYNPPITYPTLGSVWYVGNVYNVTWDISQLPPGTGPGMIVLGFITPGSENLMIDSPLAKGFSLADGSVQITVPSVPLRHSYIIVLFGDSGNASPQFTITKAPTTMMTADTVQAPTTSTSTTSSSSVSVSDAESPATATGSPTTPTPRPTPTPTPTTIKALSTSLAPAQAPTNGALSLNMPLVKAFYAGFTVAVLLLVQ